MQSSVSMWTLILGNKYRSFPTPKRTLNILHSPIQSDPGFTLITFSFPFNEPKVQESQKYVNAQIEKYPTIVGYYKMWEKSEANQ